MVQMQFFACQGLFATVVIVLAITIKGQASTCRQELAFWEYVESGEELLKSGNFESAAECLVKAVHTPDGGMHRAEAHYLLGEALDAQGRHKEALDAYRVGALSQDAMQLLQRFGLNSAVAASRGKLGLALEADGQPLVALQAYEDGVAADPGEANLWYNAGYILLVHGDNEGARRRFNGGLRVQPRSCLCAEGLGTAWFAEGRFRQALHAFEKARACNPGKLLTRQNVAAALGKLATDRDSKYTERAIAAYQSVLELDRRNPEALAKLVFLRQQICDWRWFHEEFKQLEAVTLEQLAARSRPAVVPFNALNLPFELDTLLAISTAFSPLPAPAFSFVCSPPPPLSLRPSKFLSQRRDTTPSSRRCSARSEGALYASGGLRQRFTVGFLSADLRDHPVGRDLAVIFKDLLAQDGVRVFAFAINPPPAAESDRAWVARIASATSGLKHINHLGDLEAAQEIAGLGVHLLVDLMGHTRSSRKGVLALQAAPVQVAFKGYMSTTGAQGMGLLTDALATPPEHAPWFSETFLYLPSSFFVSGHHENHAAVLDPQSTREQVDAELARLGVGGEQLTLCCFNGLYKLDRELFWGWLSLLRALPSDAILWLPEEPPEAQGHLCREAASRGVGCERLRFSGHSPFAIHVQVKGRCDLALDARQYNAHGTASDTLWGGTPLLTLPGRSMAQRVAASILAAAGAPELIARQLPDYLRIARRLARRRELRAALAARIRGARRAWRLTDTAGWAREFVAAARQAFDATMTASAAGGRPFHHVCAGATGPGP